MLILTRTPGKAFMIGDDIEVKVLRVNGNQAKIGIAAPDDVSILREELIAKESGNHGTTK